MSLHVAIAWTLGCVWVAGWVLAWLILAIGYSWGGVFERRAARVALAAPVWPLAILFLMARAAGRVVEVAVRRAELGR